MEQNSPKSPKRGRPRRVGSPTVRDVAEKAGVGIATVSRVMNGSSLVAAAKKADVLRAMQEVGYVAPVPHSRARRLKKHDGVDLKHQAVCILLLGRRTLRWITNCAPVYAYALESIEAELSRRHVHCIIRNVQRPSDLAALKSIKVDGFLIFGAGEWSEWPGFLQTFAAVNLLGEPGIGWGDSVTYNNVTTGRLAAKYLLEKGAKNTAIMGFRSGPTFGLRRTAHVEAMEAAGASVLDLCDNTMMSDPDIHIANDDVVKARVDQLLQASPGIDGLFLTSDVVAPPVFRELERRKLKPGEDFPVVTCNNERSYLSQLTKEPAVVDLLSGAMGTLAVESLLWRLRNPDSPRQSILIEPVLHIPA